MTQLANQFGITPEKGMLSPGYGNISHTLNAQLSATEASEVVTAQAVKLEDVAGNSIRVTAATAASDEIFGFVTFNTEKEGYDANEVLKVARNNTIMYMEASAAIARGASVMIVTTGNKVATQTAGNKVVGIALDKAAAGGDLIRVEIQLAPAVAV